MSKASHIKNQLLKLSVIISIVFVGAAQTNYANAQALKNFVRTYQLGFEGSFGVRSFQISSDIAAINGLDVKADGGAFGILIGSGALRAKIRQGYFYSASTVAQTVDEVKSAGVLNFYPMRSVGNKSKFQPYLTIGLERNTFKMYGAYGPNESKPKNYSVSEAPYLGKIATLQSSFGAGLEYRIETPGHFVSLFTEARYGKTIKAIASSAIFSNTTTSNQLVFNIGVGFGYNR